MPEHANKTFYPYPLCERLARLQGEVAFVNLPRLTTLLSSVAGSVTYKIDFDRDESRCCRLEVQITAQLPMICQRCLQAFDWPIDMQSVLSPVRSELEIQRLSDDYEPLMVSSTESVTLTELIEDELILVIPLMPKHPESVCLPFVPMDYPVSTSQLPEQPIKKPFAVLEALRNNRLNN